MTLLVGYTVVGILNSLKDFETNEITGRCAYIISDYACY